MLRALRVTGATLSTRLVPQARPMTTIANQMAKEAEERRTAFAQQRIDTNKAKLCDEVNAILAKPAFTKKSLAEQDRIVDKLVKTGEKKVSDHYNQLFTDGTGSCPAEVTIPQSEMQLKLLVRLGIE